MVLQLISSIIGEKANFITVGGFGANCPVAVIPCSVQKGLLILYLYFFNTSNVILSEYNDSIIT